MPDNPFDTQKSSFPQTDSEASIPAQTEADDIPPSASPQTQSESAPQPSAGIRPRVIPIDLRRTVQTDADKDRNDLLDLLESQRSKRILTGTIQGVEGGPGSNSRSVAVIYRGDYKILIPAELAVLPPEDYGGRAPAEVLHQMITRRLGAEVDYIVKGVEAEEHLAVASRLEAMRAKRSQYYSSGRDGVREGSCAEARVVSVIRAGIFIDLFGIVFILFMSPQSFFQSDSS